MNNESSGVYRTPTQEEIVEQIAEICHEANRTYCLFQGDKSQPEWKDAPAWQQESAVNGVLFALNNPHATPEDSHENWYREKVEAGWKYGATKNPEKKEHPCMVAYHELPYQQQMKDSIFQGIAKSMLKKAITGSRLVHERPLTDGEEAIDVNFNVGQNPSIARIKQAFADLHDLCIKESDAHRIKILNREAGKRRQQLAKDHPDWNADDIAKASIGELPKQVHRMGRLMALALTNIELAAMTAVKAVTR